MNKEHWQDWGSALLGVWVFVTPWVLGTPDSAAAWNFWIVGGALIAIAVAELVAFKYWKEWAIAAAGTWLFLSPRLVEFTEARALTWSAALCGLAVVAFAAWAIGDAHQILPRIARPKNDLRGDALGISVPDEHEHMAGQAARRPGGGPGVVHPGTDVQTPGQSSHS